MGHFPVVWNTTNLVSGCFHGVSKNSVAFMSEVTRSAKPSMQSSEPLNTMTQRHVPKSFKFRTPLFLYILYRVYYFINTADNYNITHIL